MMKEWSFLTNHARALVCIAHDPGAWSSLVLKRVLRLPSRALAGASAVLEGALVGADQPVRRKGPSRSPTLSS